MDPYFSDNRMLEEVLSSTFDSTYSTSSVTDINATEISNDSTISSGSIFITTQAKVTAARTACSSRANPVSATFPSPRSHLDPTIGSITESSESSRKTFDS